MEYLYRGLSSTGMKVTVLLTSGRYHDARKYSDIYPEIKNIVKVENPTGSRQGRVNVLAKALSRLSPDLVVAVNVPDVIGAVNRIRGRGTPDIRVVMAIHAIQEDFIEDVRKYAFILDGVISTNKLTQALVHKLAGIEKARLYYAPYGVADCKPSINDKVTDKYVIAWAGRLENYQKRILDIVDVAKYLAEKNIDFEILVAGDGPDRELFQNEIISSGLTDKVKLLGALNADKVSLEVYSKSDAFLMPSFWETGPIVLWEAMSCGLPVVSAQYIGSGIESALRHGENCLLYGAGDTEKAADHLASLRDAELSSRLIKNAKKLVESRYSRGVSVNTWRNVCLDIISKPAVRYTKEVTLPDAGRMDGLLGTVLAEKIRSVFGLNFNHASAGGEWPHSYGKANESSSVFWEFAKSEDARQGTSQTPLLD